MEQIKFGSVGPLVSYAQLALCRAGREDLTIGGAFGPDTDAAVRAFQTARGLTPDGIVGDRTWAALFPWMVGYMRVRVQKGDTVHAIAGRFGASERAILTANPELVPERLAVGTELTVPLPFWASAWEVPYSSLWTGLVLEGMRMRYPRLTVTPYGKSALGRTLLSASVGTGVPVGFNASHHANEWITTPLLLRMIEALLYAASDETSIGGVSAARLLDRARLTAAPLVNPDGVDLVTGFLPANSPAFQRMMGIAGGYPAIPFPSGWKANANGVDPNLGYPAGWERARAIKFAEGFTGPAPRDYVGTAPFSEPENRAMRALTERERFALTVSYHTQGGEIYWRYGDKTPPRAREIAEAFASVSGYAVTDPGADSGFAGYKDWCIDAFGIPAFTVEAGRGTNPLPLSDLPGLYRENIGILVHALMLA